MVKMLTVLVSTISNSQVFLLKNVSSFCKATHIFFSKNISIYAIFNDQNSNNTLTDDIDIVSFLNNWVKVAKADLSLLVELYSISWGV